MSASIIQVYSPSESVAFRVAILEKKPQFENSSGSIALMYVASSFQNQVNIQSSPQVRGFEYIVPNWNCCLKGCTTFDRGVWLPQGDHHGLTL